MSAAILQKTRELSHRTPAVTCRHIGKVGCVQCNATFVCFQEIKVFAGKQTLLSKQLVLNLRQFSILLSNEHDFNCQMHRG
jgi:hypothetical protein